MALIYKLAITEKIRRILAGGYISTSDRVQNAEITLAVCNVANTLLKGEMYNTIYNTDGQTIPQGAMIATYDGNNALQVQRGSSPGISVVQLPTTPLTIPDRQGVFAVYPDGYPDAEYIPIPPGVIGFWKRDKLVNPINRKMYTHEGTKVTIFDDLIGAGITKVGTKLCIFDINQYGDYDVLPITPDQEWEIIKQVVSLYIGEPYDRRQENNQPQPEPQGR